RDFHVTGVQTCALPIWIVKRLKQAGALIMGKTVTTELALFTPGKTRNPHDIARSPGGSSSGSAAAVAAGMVPLAIGTQTAGSMRSEERRVGKAGRSGGT